MVTPAKKCEAARKPSDLVPHKAYQYGVYRPRHPHTCILRCDFLCRMTFVNEAIFAGQYFAYGRRTVLYDKKETKEGG
jgi:hypothetical protein